MTAFEDNFALIKGEITDGVRQNVTNAAIYLVGQIKLTLGTGERTGKVYKVPGTKTKEYTSSGPGEAPAVLFSNLITSITHDIIVDNRYEFTARVGTIMEYARRLEFGYIDTDSLGRKYNMTARPFFRTTYLEQREKIIAIMNGELP